MRICRYNRLRILQLAYLLFLTVLCLVYINYIGNSAGRNKSEAPYLGPNFWKLISNGSVRLPQDDPNIIKYIWDTKLIEPPSNEPYNLTAPEEDPSLGQGQFIRRMLRNMTNGFFVEAGALDGETRSNTLSIEQHLGWKGLLVEGNSKNYAVMRTKNRKAWISNTCLAIKPYPHQVSFWQHFSVGKIIDPGERRQAYDKIATVQCMPLFSLLSALNVTTVDYFSLDVEGSELQVLRTIPFDKVFIKTLSVEFIHTKEGREKLLNFMVSNGYKLAGKVLNGGMANDFMFVHKSVDQ